MIDHEREAELAYQDAMLDSGEEAHALMWPDGCDAGCASCQRRLANRCENGGHEWPPDYTSGDTCWCGEWYLSRLTDGRMKVTATELC